MPDRERRDSETRTRVDEIGASMESYRRDLDHRYRRVVWLVLIAVILSLGAPLALLVRTDRQANSNTTALCALRHDLEARVKSSTDLLATHPEGLAGIPAATIRTTIDGQRRTILALSGLACA